MSDDPFVAIAEKQARQLAAASTAKQPKPLPKNVDPTKPIPDASVQARIVRGTFDPAHLTGTRTLTGDNARPTGDDFIDHGAVCDASSGPDCFLTPGQRQRLIDGYHARVDTAAGEYKAALEELRVDKLLEKRDSDIPWAIALILDLVGTRALSALIKVAGALKAADMATMQSIVSADPDGLHVSSHVAAMMHEGLRKTTDAQLQMLSKIAVDNTKKLATSAIKKQLAAQHASGRAIAVSYLEHLQKEAGIAFQALREKPPGYATDAQMIVLWNAFNIENHSRDVYRQELEDKLKRFEASGTMDIGRADNRPLGGAGVVKRDTMVVRVKFKSGYPERYAFAANDWTFVTMNTWPHERANESDLPLDSTHFHGEAIPAESRLNDVPGFQRWIDPEFVEVALERHEQIWGKPPETVELDDSNWWWEPARAEKAKAAKGTVAPSPTATRPEPAIAIPQELVLKRTP